MSRDLSTVLRYTADLKRQGESLETFARALAADIEAVKAAIRGKKPKP